MKQKRTALSKHEMRGQGFFFGSKKKGFLQGTLPQAPFTEHYH